VDVEPTQPSLLSQSQRCRTKTGVYLPTEMTFHAFESGGRLYVLGLVQDRGEHRAGWQVGVRDGAIPTIQATRAGVELEVSGASLADAAGTIFARAMHSSRRRDRDEKR
jgi:hypothetical protein